MVEVLTPKVRKHRPFFLPLGWCFLTAPPEFFGQRAHARGPSCGVEALRAQCHAVCALKVFVMTKTLPHTKRQRWCTIKKARGKAAKVTNAGHPHHGHACGGAEQCPRAVDRGLGAFLRVWARCRPQVGPKSRAWCPCCSSRGGRRRLRVRATTSESPRLSLCWVCECWAERRSPPLLLQWLWKPRWCQRCPCSKSSSRRQTPQ